MQGLILAAGRGSRLKQLTQKKPKSFNKYKDKRYIDIIINNFITNKIHKINIVVGYKKHFFQDIKCKKILNSRWQKTSIFFSLYCARKILSHNTCLVSYSDIIYKERALKILKRKKGDIVFLNNTNWKKTWKKRFKNPLRDLENFEYVKTKKGNFLTKIGGRPKSITSIKGQFSGLLKITPDGWKKVLGFIKKEKININKLDITSFFSKFVKKYQRVIKIVDYKDMWFEVDTVEDFKILNSKKNLI